MMAINNAQSGMSAISDKLNRALPVIQKIQGVWGAIAGDLQNIVNLIKTDIQDALPIIMDLGVEAALNAWKSVGEEADQYRVNAYITVKS
jgi:fumarate hydratase class II